MEFLIILSSEKNAHERFERVIVHDISTKYFNMDWTVLTL